VCHAGHSREASTAFSEACTAYLRIMSRIGSNAFEHFRPAALRSAPSLLRCQRDMNPLTLHFRSPDAQVPPQWPSPLADAMPEILARRGSPVCVLASGDQFFYGVGTLLSAHVGPQVLYCRFSDIADSYDRHGSTTVSLKTVPTPLLPPLTVVP
jgi:hypothetical protein